MIQDVCLKISNKQKEDLITGVLPKQFVAGSSSKQKLVGERLGNDVVFFKKPISANFSSKKGFASSKKERKTEINSASPEIEKENIFFSVFYSQSFLEQFLDIYIHLPINLSKTFRSHMSKNDYWYRELKAKSWN